jgi:hypothetical protein
MFLRRYVKLPAGAPSQFNCEGGWHESIVEIGEFVGELESGTPAEQRLRPPRIDERWPLLCAGCSYEFNNRDRYQFYTTPIPQLLDD